MIVVTDDYFGGETGFQSILNDYYENAIAELPEKDQMKARRFIEEGLIVAGRRVGMTEGVEKERYNIDQDLLLQLLDSRLIRAEITHLGRSFEVSHDTLVEPIVKSYEIRHLKELEVKRLAELRKARRQFFLASGIALVGVGLSAATLIFYFQSRENERKAIQNQKIVSEQRDSIQTVFESLTQSIIDKAKNEYEKNIELGKAAADATKFSEALERFNTAQQVLIDFREKNIGPDALIVSGSDDLEALIEDTRRRGGRQIAFESLIKEGEEFEQQGPEFLMDAKEKYEEALQLNYNNTLADARLRALTGKLDLAFRQFIELADDRFDAGGQRGFTDALKYYRLAQRIKENDDYVNGQIQRCESNLGN